MSGLKDRLKGVKAWACGPVRAPWMKSMMEQNPTAFLELLDVVEDWVRGGEVRSSFKTKNALSIVLEQDEVIGTFVRRSALAGFIENAKQGRIDFGEARRATQTGKPEGKNQGSAKPASRKRPAKSNGQRRGR